MKITRAEIDSIIERSKQWTRHREAMQMGIPVDRDRSFRRIVTDDSGLS